jgi:hypothetical protein
MNIQSQFPETLQDGDSAVERPNCHGEYEVRDERTVDLEGNRQDCNVSEDAVRSGSLKSFLDRRNESRLRESRRSGIRPPSALKRRFWAVFGNIGDFDSGRVGSDRRGRSVL